MKVQEIFEKKDRQFAGKTAPHKDYIYGKYYYESTDNSTDVKFYKDN